MKTIYSDKHLGHSGHNELNGGRILPSFELPSRAEYIVARVRERGLGEVLPSIEHDLSTASKVHDPAFLAFLPTAWEHWLAEGNSGPALPSFELPSRAEYIVARVRERSLGEVLPPVEHDLSTASKVHDPAFLAFLPTAWERWLAEGNTGPALPSSWPAKGLRRDLVPTSATGLLGHYSIDASASFVEGTWAAAKAAHDCALTAAGLVAGGERAAFALCRPPGHHAGADFMGGYCFINNAAVAAQSFLEGGANRVAILDVDYHHGNGTQQIFYERSDVMVVNLHADPREEYPYFLGAAEETGAGAGLG